MLPAIIAALMIIVVTHYRIKLRITSWAECYHCQSVVSFSPFRATLCLFLGNIPFLCANSSNIHSLQVFYQTCLSKNLVCCLLEFKKSLNLLSTATLSAKRAQTYPHPLSSSSVLHPQWKGYFSFHWHRTSSCFPRTSRRQPPSVLSSQHFHHPGVFTLLADKQMQVSLLVSKSET